MHFSTHLRLKVEFNVQGPQLHIEIVLLLDMTHFDLQTHSI